MPETPETTPSRAADKIAASAIGRAPGGRPPGRHMLLELGFVVREDGQWMLVVHQDVDGATMGWVPRAQVTIP